MCPDNDHQAVDESAAEKNANNHAGLPNTFRPVVTTDILGLLGQDKAKFETEMGGTSEVAAAVKLVAQELVLQTMTTQTIKVKQADIERAIRAAKAAGLPVLRIIARPDGYVIETENGLVPKTDPVRISRKPVL
jgi:hypothetical protein